MERDPAEFWEQLDVQLRHLRRSAEAYDDGDITEAQRLAVTIRVLVNDTRTQTSLFKHLGVKGRLLFTDTHVRSPGGLPKGAIILHAGLAQVQMPIGGDVTFAPPLGNLSPERTGPPMPFGKWWGNMLVKDLHGESFSRSDFVLSVADQDGGAHIDRRLRPKYAALTRGNSMGLSGSSADGGVAPLGRSIALVTVRQIAYEVQETVLLNQKVLTR